MPIAPPLVLYLLAIVGASLLGGKLASLMRMTHLRTQLLMSGVGGLMLGIAMMHLLPHATAALGSPTRAGTGALAGLTVMFLLIRLFHTHDHELPVVEPDLRDGTTGHADHPAHCQHHHHTDPRGISWAGLFLGLVLHTMVDGVALASSVLADGGGSTWWPPAGLGTFLAVLLHKPLDAFAITSVMNRQHWGSNAQNIANAAFSVACPIGAVAFYFGVASSPDTSTVLGWGLAVSAGFFVGIALADLLPEVAFHDHDRGKLTFAFLVGIAAAVAIENLPGHTHGV